WFLEKNTYNYVFGLEESYGCLAGTHARDKDAIVAVMCLCEVAAYCKKQGITVWDMMLDMYEKYGYFKEDLYTITMKGKEGSEQIAAIMEGLRANPPKEFGSWKVLAMRDYKKDERIDLITNEKSSTNLPNSNVLYFELSDDAWCCARPSGTEPKIKFYMGVKGESLEDAKTKVVELTDALKAKIQ
ncbi:MAG: phospho-sugar mutase, partial [Bacillota bacterium]|nr:phospho-sugar mutase [Bacillota bacterium]